VFACCMSSCTTFTSSPLPLRSVAYGAGRMPAEVAHDSDLSRRRLQVRLVKRTWPVRQFSSAVRASKNPVLVGRVGTLQPPIPQDFGQSQIEWNRFARGFRFAVTDVLHDDRANDMDHRLLKIDVAPLETDVLPLSIPMELAEGFAWWSDVQPEAGFERKINLILQPMESWSESMRMWAKSTETMRTSLTRMKARR
jgi:hypothetical protein